MKRKGLNSVQTKTSNRLLVLQLLCMMGGGSRTELTRRTRLAKMTVSNITAELIQNGVLYEKETLESENQGAGRKQMLLSFSERAPAVIGVWLSRDSCMGIAAAMDLEVLQQRTIPLEEGETAFSLLHKLESLCAFLRDSVSGQREVVGVGIASIGPLDIRQGVLLNPPNFFDIRDIPIAEELEKRLELPVFLENDTNAGALAEKYFGRCADCTDFVYVGLTNGLSMGIVLRDSLLHGRHGFAGEAGHTTIDPMGKVCYCGRRGCLETVCTVPALTKAAEAELDSRCTSFEQLCRLCARSSRAADWMLEKLGALVEAMANISNILDPEKIIIGHEGALLPQTILQALETGVNERILAGKQAHISVEPSSFDALAAVYGAAAVVLKKVFDGQVGYSLFFGE